MQDFAKKESQMICGRLRPAKRIVNGRPTDLGNEPTGHRGANSEDASCLMCGQQHTVLDWENVCRVALMVTPEATGDVADEAWEAISTIRAILKQQSKPMTVTMQSVFLRRAEDEAVCRKLFEAYYGDRMPATSFVVQRPCGGQSLAIEAWALGGDGVELDFHGPQIVSVAYDGLRWIHVGQVTPPAGVTSACEQSKIVFQQLAQRLHNAAASFRDVVRVWLYMGDITKIQNGIERYRELNRARTDFFDTERDHGRMRLDSEKQCVYPASTGIGTDSRGLNVSCLALQTDRSDARLVALENPRQTAAFNYDASFSAKSPKFSRAVAVVTDDYVTTWISGTASVVNSQSVHLGDVAKQTEQTIDNIQTLISHENFQRHGIQAAGARLSDVAKLRVYVKRPEDYEICREICRRRFGSLPTIYAQADVCRAELLVEIEGVAFSRTGSQES